jgi:hypothetical protein
MFYDNKRADFKTLPIEEQIEYSLRDSQLVMELSKYNDFEVLDAMLAVAEITELDFEKVCRTNLSTWWHIWCASNEKRNHMSISLSGITIQNYAKNKN